MNKALPFGERTISIAQTPVAGITVPGVSTYGSLYDGALGLKIGDGTKKMSRKVKGWAEDGYRYDEIDN